MHSMLKRLATGCLALSLVAATALVNAQTIKPIAVKKGIKATRVDTSSFFPQIDERVQVQPLRPENPPLPLSRGTVNQLISGGFNGKSRGSLGAQFPGISMTGWYPPDPTLAVGPNHIVSTVNSSIAFFTKAGVKQFQTTSGGTGGFFNASLGATSFQFDPKCFYDRISGRFVIIFDEEQDSPAVSKILLAVSDDSDPNGTWYQYRFEAKVTVSGNDYWLDYPGFGYNKDAYVITGNMFGFTTGFAGAQFIVIPKAPLLTGSAASATSFRDGSGGSVQVAQMISATSPFVYAVSHSSTTALKIYAVQNGGSASPSIVSTTVAIPSSPGPNRTAQTTTPTGTPPPPTNTLDTIDGRVFNAVWRDGKLLAAHNSTDGRISVHWHEINTNNWPTSGAVSLSQSGIISNGSVDCHMVGISRNYQGDISAIFNTSSTTLTANINFVGRNYFDPAGTMGSFNLLESSAGNNYTLGRWGDYCAVDVDPVDDNTFWGVGMSVASDNTWRTSIYSWVITPPLDLSSLGVSPNVVVGGAANSTGTVTFNHLVGPNGATVSLSSSNPAAASVPATITIPGTGVNSATFTITTSAVASITPVTITATLGGTQKTAVLTVNPSTLQLLGNPDFEAGANPSPWVVSTASIIDNNPMFAPHGGSWKAILGGYGTTHTDTMTQTVTVPAGAAAVSLKYWLWINSNENSPRNGDRSMYDWCYVRVRDVAGNVLKTLASHNNNQHNTQYFQQSFDMTEFRGQTIVLSFELSENAAIPTRFLLDDFDMTATF